MKKFLFAACAVSLVGCASAPGTTSDNDPYEAFNRDVLAFNLGLDKYVLEPVAKAYIAVTPQFGREGVSNFLSNLNSPVVLVNDVLQGKPGRALDTTYRFAINTTIGVAGLWDAAEYFGLEGHDEDFGQTLATWGVDSGPYLVLPVIGPSNPRDFTGLVVDRAFEPLTWTEFASDEDLDDDLRLGLGILGAINGRAQAQGAIETLKEQPEPYVALKRAYLAQRDNAINDGQNEQDPYEDLPDFDDLEE